MEKQTDVSRAEGKLAGAVKAFSYDFRDKTVLDIGSSTGGFTELALRLGAKKVIAVEKGTNQMKAPLRFDKRIELYEKTDIFTVAVTEKRFLADASAHPVSRSKRCSSSTATSGGCSKNVFLTTAIDTILADVSFISLTKVLKHAKNKLANSKTDFLVMLKPQFEARAEQLWKGVVKNEKMRREIIKDFEGWLKKEEFIVKAKRDNEVIGRNGNQERFYWLKLATKR